MSTLLYRIRTGDASEFEDILARQAFADELPPDELPVKPDEGFGGSGQTERCANGAARPHEATGAAGLYLAWRCRASRGPFSVRLRSSVRSARPPATALSITSTALL